MNNPDKENKIREIIRLGHIAQILLRDGRVVLCPSVALNRDVRHSNPAKNPEQAMWTLGSETSHDISNKFDICCVSIYQTDRVMSVGCVGLSILDNKEVKVLAAYRDSGIYLVSHIDEPETGLHIAFNYVIPTDPIIKPKTLTIEEIEKKLGYPIIIKKQ